MISIIGGVIASSIQTNLLDTVYVVIDTTSTSYGLCSFNVSPFELPVGTGYFFLTAEDITSTSYELCSFNVSPFELPSELGYYFLTAEDITSTSYELCSFNVSPLEIQNIMPLDPLTINGIQTTIYSVDSDAETLLGITGFRYPSFTFWEVLTSVGDSFKAIPTYRNSLTCWLSGGSSWYDASVQPLSARMVIGIDGKIYRTTPVALKPFVSLIDIPNLQLWLDASDSNTILLDTSLASTFNSNYIYYDRSTSGTTNTNQLLTSKYPTSTAPTIFDIYTGTGNWTFEGHFYVPVGVSERGTLMAVGNGGAYGNALLVVFDAASGKVIVYQQSSSASYTRITSSSTFQPSQWMHVAVTIDSSSNMKLYVNGTDQGTGISSTNKSNCLFTIHGSYDNNWSLYTESSMYCHNVRVSDIVRYSSAFVVPNSNFVSDVNTIFLTHTTGELVDISSNNIPVTVYGDPSVSSGLFDKTRTWLDKSPNALTAEQVNYYNQSDYLLAEINNLNVLSFNGINNYLNLSQPIDLSSDFTHFFVYQRSPASGIVNVSLGNTISDNASPFLHSSDNYIYSGDRRSNSTQLYEGLIVAGARKNEYLSLSGQSIPFTTSWGGTKTSTVNTVGIYRNGAGYHKGLMGEIIQTSAMLPDSEVDLVCRTLTEKWSADPYLSNISLSLNASTISQATLYGNTTTTSEVTHYNSESIKFDGSGDYLSVSRNLFPYTSSSWTFELWINLIDLTANRGIATMSDLMQFEIQNNTNTFFRWRTGSSIPGHINGWFGLNFNTTYSSNQWYHLAVSVDNFFLRFFVNGIKKGEGNIGGIGTPGSQQTSLLYIGGSDTYPYNGSMNTFSKGYMEDIRITDGVARYVDNFIPPQKSIN